MHFPPSVTYKVKYRVASKPTRQKLKENDIIRPFFLSMNKFVLVIFKIKQRYMAALSLNDNEKLTEIWLSSFVRIDRLQIMAWYKNNAHKKR